MWLMYVFLSIRGCEYQPRYKPHGVPLVVIGNIFHQPIFQRDENKLLITTYMGIYRERADPYRNGSHFIWIYVAELFPHEVV